MKKNLIAGICGLTLALAASSSAMADFPEGPETNPQLNPATEGAFALAETLLSITAAFVTNGGCAPIGGPFNISVGIDGNGTATYGDQLPISLNVARDPGPEPVYGTFYHVTQNGMGQIDAANKIEGYDGTLSYSMGGAIMISNSIFQMFEFSIPVLWDEHNIKDFWLSKQNEFGKIIEDYGVEVITKLHYPVSKWRQTSFHEKSDGKAGHLEANKWLIQTDGLPGCHISIGGWNVKNFFGRFTVSGNIEVSPF